jgi:hypothetical protein
MGPVQREKEVMPATGILLQKPFSKAPPFMIETALSKFTSTNGSYVCPSLKIDF